MCPSVSAAFEIFVLVPYYLWFEFFLSLGGKTEKLDCINKDEVSDSLSKG